MIFDGRKRSAWQSFHGRSERDQLTVLPGSFNFRVDPGDSNPGMTGERAELMEVIPSLYHYEDALEQTIWIAFETKFPALYFEPNTPSAWNFIFQLHESGAQFQSPFALRVNAYKQPYLDLSIYGGDPYNATRRDIPLTLSVIRDHWYRFMFKLVLSPTGGLVKPWINGVPGNPVVTPTLYEGRGVYPKLGFYRGLSQNNMRVTHRRFRIARTRAGLAL